MPRLPVPFNSKRRSPAQQKALTFGQKLGAKAARLGRRVTTKTRRKLSSMNEQSSSTHPSTLSHRLRSENDSQETSTSTASPDFPVTSQVSPRKTRKMMRSSLLDASPPTTPSTSSRRRLWNVHNKVNCDPAVTAPVAFPSPRAQVQDSSNIRSLNSQLSDKNRQLHNLQRRFNRLKASLMPYKKLARDRRNSGHAPDSKLQDPTSQLDQLPIESLSPEITPQPLVGSPPPTRDDLTITLEPLRLQKKVIELAKSRDALRKRLLRSQTRAATSTTKVAVLRAWSSLRKEQLLEHLLGVLEGLDAAKIEDLYATNLEERVRLDQRTSGTTLDDTARIDEVDSDFELESEGDD